jgi:hypothetical protein
MKLKVSLPFILRSPSYRRTITRRLGTNNSAPNFGGVGIIPPGGKNPMGLKYHRKDFTAGPCYLPADAHTPALWPWWRDPSVVAPVALFLLIGLGLYLIGGF